MWTRNHLILKGFRVKRRSCQGVHKCIRKYGLLTKIKVLIKTPQICSIPRVYSVRASFFTHCSSILNLKCRIFKCFLPNLKYVDL